MDGVGINLVYNIIYQILVIIVPLVISPYLARTLGVEQIGVYSYTYSIVFYFMIFAVLGISNYGNRSIAKIRDDKEKTSKMFCSIYSLQLCLSIIVIFTYSVYCVLISRTYVLLSWIQGLYIISNMLDITWYFYGKENFKLTVLRNAAVKFISLVAILYFVKGPDDVWIYTLIMSGSTVLGQAMLWPQLFKEVKLTRVSFSGMIAHLKPAFILFIPVLAISVFSFMDKVMLGNISGMVETGFYENSEKIISIPKAMITAVGTVMLPRTSNMLAKGKNDEIKSNIQITMIGVLAVAFACAFGLSAVANTFAPVFWGTGFERCGTIIAYMTPALIFSVFGNVIRTQYLIPKEMDSAYTISLVLGAVTNFVINSLLIGRYGALGATIGTIAAEAVLCIYQTWAVRKHLEIKCYLSNGVPFLIIGLIMFLAIKVIEPFISVSIIGLVAEIIVGGSIYIILCVIYIKHSHNEMVCQLYENIMRRIKVKMRK